MLPDSYDLSFINIVYSIENALIGYMLIGLKAYQFKPVSPTSFLVHMIYFDTIFFSVNRKDKGSASRDFSVLNVWVFLTGVNPWRTIAASFV
ncbi:hypothetical protein [Nitrosomonas sp.]|uniref:hypothetical protein n=1 Tax=Nitrosomonas sp. TaxID=42353 RepID=UPI002852CA96|nr:hypothetical protein [Nitrosomonas sp.]